MSGDNGNGSRKANGGNGDGRDRQGRFKAGNPGGPGNPHAKQTHEIHRTLCEAVTLDDLRAILQALVNKAKDGDVIAAREVLDRRLGKAPLRIEDDNGTPMVLTLSFDR